MPIIWFYSTGTAHTVARRFGRIPVTDVYAMMADQVDPSVESLEKLRPAIVMRLLLTAAYVV